jgi:hypothetical protein
MSDCPHDTGYLHLGHIICDHCHEPITEEDA